MNTSNTNKPSDKTDKPATPAQQLLHREVTRKEFVTTAGFGLVSILGFSTMIHFLAGHFGRSAATRSSRGYNSGPYGG